MFGEEEFVRSSGRYCEWGWLDDTESSPFVAAKVPVGTCVKMPANPKLDSKMPALAYPKNGKDVGIIFCLLRIEGCPRTLLAPINHYRSDMTNPLKVMMRTSKLRVYLYEDKPEPSAQFVFDVDLSRAKPILDSLSSLPPWTDAEFLDVLLSIKDSPDELWKNLP